MKQFTKPHLLQAQINRLRSRGTKIGFVPTMGALHEGHLSLIRRARKENDVVVASIFVNPTQFGPKEDYKKYPRPKARDHELLKTEKVDILYAPSAKTMYPEGYSTYVDVDSNQSLTKVLCGKSRPGHFRGVATVVLKLFNAVYPDRAYFGQKDYQQSVVIKKLVQDLDLAVQIRVCPIVRQRDGLALSSRNQYLNETQRQKALSLFQTLKWIKTESKKRNRISFAKLKKQARQRLAKQVNRIDYLEFVDPKDLRILSQYQPKMVVATACFVGKTRLIDNVIISSR